MIVAVSTLSQMWQDGLTALHVAAKNGSADFVKRLLASDTILVNSVDAVGLRSTQSSTCLVVKLTTPPPPKK